MILPSEIGLIPCSLNIANWQTFVLKCKYLAIIVGGNMTITMEFSGNIIYWRGPAPWYFVPIPQNQSEEIRDISDLVTYGWGVIPVGVQIGDTEWTTSLFPKDGVYLVPIKASIRKAEKLEQGDMVTIQLQIEMQNA